VWSNKRGDTEIELYTYVKFTIKQDGTLWLGNAHTVSHAPGVTGLNTSTTRFSWSGKDVTTSGV
jgi:hypothetical protein